MTEIQWALDNGLNYLNPEAVSKDDAHFIWVDVETTGLDIHSDVILEVGAVITDGEGFVLSEPVSWLCNGGLKNAARYGLAIENMNRNNTIVREMHQKSGLTVDWLNKISYSYAEIERQLLKYVARYADSKTLLIAGSSVKFDYYMLQEFMPTFIDSLHYRDINSSTLKELIRRYYPTVYAELDENTQPKKLHRVLPDLVDSINEFTYYINEVFYDRTGR